MAIVDRSRTPPPGITTVDVCIVGSGCAGATAAWVLAEAGHDVLVLEEGGDYTGADLTQRDGEMYDQLYMDRGGRTTADLSISVLQGRVLGGGGVINASDVVPLQDPVLAHWQRHHGLSDWSPAALAPYTERALEDLSASRIDEDQVNRANALLREGTEVLGLQGEVMRHNRVGCAGLGTCLIGCPANAKRNPRFVALPAALEAGATAWTRARAVHIGQADQEMKRIVVRSLDPLGYQETGEAAVRARVVLLAANAVGSAALLLRSGLGNDHVGRHLGLQPQLPLLAMFDEPVRAFRGIPQSYAITEFERLDEERGLGGFRVEGIMGTPGIVASLLPWAGRDAKRVMTRYPHLAASLLLTPDRHVGRVEAGDGARPILRYDLPGSNRDRFRRAVKVAARAYFAAGAHRVIVPTTPALVFESEADLSAVDAFPFAPATAPLLSAHQQGGVRMAPSPADGAADPEGRVYGTRDVYCIDSGLYPTSASSHTMTPILATARYLADRLVSRLG